MLISETYRKLNCELHEARNDWGSHVDEWTVRSAAKFNPKSVLDYGCGKQALKQVLRGVDVRCYDPAIPELSAAPEPADIVVCRAVLEHVEPEYLDAVLDDIKRLSNRAVVIKVTLIPSSLTLSDGRNAHLILESENWWLEKFIHRWSLLYAERMRQGLRFIGGTC